MQPHNLPGFAHNGAFTKILPQSLSTDFVDIFGGALFSASPMQHNLTLGQDAIRTALASVPSAPGIYKMLNRAGEVIYVGKAKQLHHRVASYAQGKAANTRTMRMISEVAHVEVVVVQSEAEALLLEAALIKKLRPYYNILLKDDKSFPYLLITRDHPFPQITKHRGAQKTPGDYFGPFASVGALNHAMTLLQKIFLIRPCSDGYFKNRSRPCLKYQIKRCSAPCVNYISASDYAAQVARAKDFLRGKHRDLQSVLEKEMREASAALQYELAASLRDKIHSLTRVQEEQSLYARGLKDADIIALAREGNTSVVQVFFYRDGAHFGHQSFHPSHNVEASDPEVMAAFLAQFYQSHPPPGEILVNLPPSDTELLAEALQLSAGHAVTITCPERGDKRARMEHATENAEAELRRTHAQRERNLVHLARLQELFHLPTIPERIEVYDNSHLMGSAALGAMIVATAEGFDKRGYRTFRMKVAATDDDYAMMREMFARRSARILREGNAPDLMLIDGGKGQLAAARAATDAAGISVPLVAIAKGEDRNAGREWFFTTDRAPFQLPVGDPLLFYLERIRDEAHRFAISRHRKKRDASMRVSVLDDIPMIGAARKRALLHHFGSRDAIATAPLSELMRVDGISKKIAQGIYQFFHR